MKKKLKWAILPAVIAMTGTTVALTACKPKNPPVEEHTHAYKWTWDDDEHWKVCGADGAEEDGTRGEHFYENGECECGKEEPVEEKTYGKAEGSIKLRKLGDQEPDYSDVTVAVSDSGAQCSLDAANGKFEITNLQAGKEHLLTISKPGYIDYKMTVQTETDKTVKISPTNGCVLDYDVFTHGTHDDPNDSWKIYGHPEYIEKSHVNDENGYFMIYDGANDFYQYTNDKYVDVMASATFKMDMTPSSGSVRTSMPYIKLVFDDKKAISVRLQNQGENAKAQWMGDLNNKVWEESAISGEWGFTAYNTDPLNMVLLNKYKTDGLKLTIARKGDKVSAYVDDVYAGTQTLPAEYAEKECRVCFAAGGLQSGDWKIPFELLAGEKVKLDVAVTWRKLGKTAKLPVGTQVTLKAADGTENVLSVDANGKISTGADFVSGMYTASVNGYVAKGVVVDKKLGELELEYEVFKDGKGGDGAWNYGKPANIDKSHVNDKDGYFILKNGTNDFYQYTNDEYDEVTASVTYKNGMVGTGDVNANPYIKLVFDGNKAVMVRMQVGGNNKKIQWIPSSTWEGITGIVDTWDFTEPSFDPLSDELMNKYNTDGLKITLVRKGIYVHAYVDGVYAGTQTLPAEYADKKCRVAFTAGQVQSGEWNIPFEISDTAQISEGSVSAAITGHTFGTSGNTITAGTAVKLSATGFADISTTVVEENGALKIKVPALANVAWTVKVNGYQDAKITVNKDQTYGEQIVLNSNSFSLVKTWGRLSSVHSEDGNSAQITMTNEMETALTNVKYNDVAVSLYLSAQNMSKSGSLGNQGIAFRFSDNKFAIIRMQGDKKIQFATAENTIHDTGSADGANWLDLIFFKQDGTNQPDPKASEYLAKFEAGTLKLTAVRKGKKIYAFLEDTLLGVFGFDDKYATDDQVQVGWYQYGTPNGEPKTRRFDLESVDTFISDIDADYATVVGGWRMSGGKLGTGSAQKNLLEFKAADSTKESATIHIDVGTQGKDQGLIYHFTNGKYIAVRYQQAGGSLKVQYTQDTTYYSNNSLKTWTDWLFTNKLSTDQQSKFNTSGLDLTFIREGATFKTYIGDPQVGYVLLDTATLDAEYAEMGGNMGIMMWYEGSGKNFTYEHKVGNDVVAPATT